jgi:hypothetical protein
MLSSWMGMQAQIETRCCDLKVIEAVAGLQHYASEISARPKEKQSEGVI